MGAARRVAVGSNTLNGSFKEKKLFHFNAKAVFAHIMQHSCFQRNERKRELLVQVAKSTVACLRLCNKYYGKLEKIFREDDTPDDRVAIYIPSSAAAEFI